MKILLINSEYPPIGGGAGNASAHLAQALARRGDQPTVLTVGFGGLPAAEQQGAVRVVRWAGRRRLADRSGAAEQAAFMLTATAAARRLVSESRPDVSLAFFGVPCGAVSLYLQVAHRIPYVVSLRGGDVPGFRPYDFARYHRWMSPLIRLVWRRARAVVANSRGLRRLASAFDRAVPIEIIPNGVDLAGFSGGGRDWEPARLLFVGRVVYQKGLDLLLEALAGLKEQPWSLTVVGDGSQREPLRLRAGQLGLDDRIEFSGWLSGDDLRQAYRRANLFVFPSRHEGMPNAVLEAMASGLPVVASHIAGNEELVTSGDTGLLIPADDAPALRQALHSLLPDPGRRERMGEAGRRRVEANYSWDGVAAAYHELLLRAAGGG